MRNGLDMAFSSNQNQLYNFGWLLTSTEQEPELTPEASLDFWIAANRRALEIGDRLFRERFLVINMDTLWQDASRCVAELLEFIGRDTDDALVSRLARLPARPASSGRHRDQDLTRFSPAQLDAVGIGFGPSKPR